ncbi:hypothetical protein M427DRAFT_68953 [Gonapodya prolifera JEL478]|uniref:Uncharacterized protein n=1 Tax=Gonapodya prolifera (strain JEL478) TaxID=1344416 RepID=A0A139AIW1_GONPJ|nr:hypothetical protein M427DRAFT_68953 [Gonapodya prolifera JEL478]|eukprot:KXS16659.1 hypothetical protein M427DRAFT_68953 [Gonapodya prolifera JEL478]
MESGDSPSSLPIPSSRLSPPLPSESSHPATLAGRNFLPPNRRVRMPQSPASRMSRLRNGVQTFGPPAGMFVVPLNDLEQQSLGQNEGVGVPSDGRMGRSPSISLVSLPNTGAEGSNLGGNRVPSRSSSLFSLPRETESDTAFDEDGDGDSDSDDELEGYSVHSRRPHHGPASQTTSGSSQSSLPVTGKRLGSAMDTDSNGSDSPRFGPVFGVQSFQFPALGGGSAVAAFGNNVFNHLNATGWLNTLQTAQEPLSLPPSASPAKRRRVSSPHFTGSDIAMEDVPLGSPGLQGRTPRQTPNNYSLDAASFFSSAGVGVLDGAITDSPQMDSIDTMMMSPRTGSPATEPDLGTATLAPGLPSAFPSRQSGTGIPTTPRRESFSVSHALRSTKAGISRVSALLAAERNPAAVEAIHERETTTLLKGTDGRDSSAALTLHPHPVVHHGTLSWVSGDTSPSGTEFPTQGLDRPVSAQHPHFHTGTRLRSVALVDVAPDSPSMMSSGPDSSTGDLSESNSATPTSVPSVTDLPKVSSPAMSGSSLVIEDDALGAVGGVPLAMQLAPVPNKEIRNPAQYVSHTSKLNPENNYLNRSAHPEVYGSSPVLTTFVPSPSGTPVVTAVTLSPGLGRSLKRKFSEDPTQLHLDSVKRHHRTQSGASISPHGHVSTASGSPSPSSNSAMSITPTAPSPSTELRPRATPGRVWADGGSVSSILLKPRRSDSTDTQQSEGGVSEGGMLQMGGPGKIGGHGHGGGFLNIQGAQEELVRMKIKGGIGGEGE